MVSLMVALRQNDAAKLAFCIVGVMSTLLVYGLLQERIMRAPYGKEKEFFTYSLFIVFCNRLLTGSVAVTLMLIRRNSLIPVAPVYKYGAVSLSNVLSTTCQYEALKHVSFPVQTLGKCAKMLPVMVWGTFIMQKGYGRNDYLVAALVTTGCAVFFLTAVPVEDTLMRRGSKSSLWGISLMLGYLGFDGFTSTFQDKLFKGYNMDIYNQILYTTLCSGAISMLGMLGQGQWLDAVNFIVQHPDCFLDIALLSCAATTSQFFISYTIRSFGALVFATLMTTRQLISIFLSCILFAHPLTVQQWGAAIVVFGSLYFKSYVSAKKRSGIVDSITSNSTSKVEKKLDHYSLLHRDLDVEADRHVANDVNNNQSIES